MSEVSSRVRQTITNLRTEAVYELAKMEDELASTNERLSRIQADVSDKRELVEEYDYVLNLLPAATPDEEPTEDPVDSEG